MADRLVVYLGGHGSCAVGVGADGGLAEPVASGQALPRQLDRATDVEIFPLTSGAAAYLRGQFLTPSERDRWQPVRAVLHDDSGGPLAGPFATPWRLSLALAGYRDAGNPASLQLSAPGLTASQYARRVGNLLLGQDVNTAARLDGGGRYTSDQIQRDLLPDHSCTYLMEDRLPHPIADLYLPSAPGRRSSSQASWCDGVSRTRAERETKLDAATLAALAGNTLVTATVTDAWEGFRHQVARLFGRSEPDAPAENRLDATRNQLAAASPMELESVRARLAGQWEVRFADLLADHPDAAVELEALVREISPGAVSAGINSAAAGHDMTAHAEHGSAAMNVANAPVTVGPTSPGPTSE